ncbi:hypothetical protein HpDR99_05850 [Helicobacter pylori]
MSLIAQLLPLLVFLKALKTLKFKEKPASKIPKKYKATPLDYTIVKLHIV